MPTIDAVTIGETMALIRTSNPGKPKNQASCTLAVGGAESNVAIGLARLGHKVRWISALGDDAFGDMVVEVLKSEGVDVVATRSKLHPTGLMFKTPSTGSERFVSYYRSGSAAANAKLSELALDSITEAKVLHVSGIYPALSEHCGEIITAVMTVAKSAGVMVSLDINYRPALWDKSRAADTLRSLVPLADIVFGDKQELQMLFENEISESAKLLAAVQELGASDVIMKQGQDGATALVDSAIWQQAIFPVEVIDTVGAGDAFVAGYISGWLDDESIQQRLERAAVCGALACLNLGDWEGSPSREELVAAGGGVRG